MNIILKCFEHEKPSCSMFLPFWFISVICNCCIALLSLLVLQYPMYLSSSNIYFSYYFVLQVIFCYHFVVLSQYIILCLSNYLFFFLYPIFISCLRQYVNLHIILSYFSISKIIVKLYIIYSNYIM